MAKQLTDDESNIRRKSRRRLIGAAALTLAVVVILPMVLDNEPKPAGQDIELRIPDPDKAGEFVPSVAIPEASVVSPSAASAVEPSAAMAADPAVAAAGVAKPPVAGSTEPVAKNHSSKEAPGKTQAAASQSTKPRVADKPAHAVAEGYVAQVGAYSHADTAKQELGKLKKWGFKAYIEKAGDTMRVRVGPFISREKAEKAGQMLEKHGLHPVILSAK